MVKVTFRYSWTRPTLSGDEKTTFHNRTMICNDMETFYSRSTKFIHNFVKGEGKIVKILKIEEDA